MMCHDEATHSVHYVPHIPQAYHLTVAEGNFCSHKNIIKNNNTKLKPFSVRRMLHATTLWDHHTDAKEQNYRVEQSKANPLPKHLENIRQKKLF